RPVMGAIASQQADQVVVTSDNPRSERPEAIISQVLLGLVQSRSVRVQSDRAQAIVDAIFRAAPADVVLIAGKGHEATQEIAGVKYAFLDRAHAEQALLGRRVSDGEVRTCTP
ncbi:MAG: UDP-N-acetylmuramoyl-L-alanyl-D-glutamate--2,6-diaminopimelate ligase, partial [Rhodoferax sp.]|nr:UDP-N-acetylmuramoyl-L-alanyl-D-glutamate--2,6-diaminopimelate ligase [Rhodoferax sp.]